MLNENIIRKIRKCLALSESSNPHEAAAALRQANALMQANSLSIEQINAVEIGEGESKSRTMARCKPAQWEIYLANVISSAFGCKIIFLQKISKFSRGKPLYNAGSFVFIGMSAQAKIAAYTQDVLSNKCKKARATWIKEELEGLSSLPKGKEKATALGDEFSIGWVHQVKQLVYEFSNPEGIDDAIEKYINNKNIFGSHVGRAPKKQEKEYIFYAQNQGAKAAQGTSIHRPMESGLFNPKLLD